MEVSITQFLDDIIKALEKREKKSKFPQIITDHSKKLLSELFNMIYGTLQKQLSEGKKNFQNDCEILIDDIYDSLINGRSLIPIFWKTMRLSKEIKSGQKVSKSHLNKCKQFQYHLESQYKAGDLVISQRTIFNYSKSGYSDKSRETRESIHSVVYILLDYFVSNDSYRKYFCEYVKQLFAQVYDIVPCEPDMRNTINFRQFGTKKDEDKENINALIFFMWKNKIRLLKREQEINEPRDQEGDKLEFELTLKLGSIFGKYLGEKELFDTVRLCNEKAVIDNQEYIKNLYPCLIEEDSTFLKYEYCVSWISYKYLNPDIQSDSDEYRAFLLYYLLHKLPWTDYLKEQHIEFNIRFDYFDYCLQYFESSETISDSVTDINQCLKKSTAYSKDFLETTKQLLNLEQAIVLSDAFIRCLEEQQTKKKGD